ncbi:MAG: FKBP-type peptidyl-prolyl cis-trans isomerase [Muribaculaceae bacterium]|nr:FKBP-type peptidyl-prolyl cis-trans isomerase [Muribaculaceae bacterium]
MRSRILAAAILPVAMWLPAEAASPTQAETDSVSMAIATVTADYINHAMQQSYGQDAQARAKYLDGIKAAFNVSAAEQPYYRGILEGMQLAGRIESMRRQGLPIDHTAYMGAFEATINGQSSGMNAQQANDYMQEYMMRHQAPDTVSTASQMAFLAEKAKQRGVTVTPSGLEFEVITEGEGSMPTKADKVRVLYTGRLTDGTVFDKSQEPVEFDVARLVPGFTAGLTMMKPGGTYRLYIPASLGYGSQGVRGVIPGNSVLDFEVQLLEVIPGSN